MSTATPKKAQQEPEQEPEQEQEQQPPEQKPEQPEQEQRQPATPATIKPKRYADTDYITGAKAPAARYGVIDSTGAVTPTEDNGATEPKPGERGIIIVQEGDTVTDGIRRQLGLAD